MTRSNAMPRGAINGAPGDERMQDFCQRLLHHWSPPPAIFCPACGRRLPVLRRPHGMHIKCLQRARELIEATTAGTTPAAKGKEAAQTNR